jgi:hypothetical protein
MQLLKQGGLDLNTAHEVNSRNFSKFRYFCFQSTNNHIPSKHISYYTPQDYLLAKFSPLATSIFKFRNKTLVWKHKDVAMSREGHHVAASLMLFHLKRVSSNS